MTFKNKKDKSEYEYLRTQLLLNKLENVFDKRKKVILRKYLYKFKKISVLPEKNNKYLYDNNSNDYSKSNNNDKSIEEENDLNLNKLVRNSIHPYIKKRSQGKIEQIKYMNIINNLKGCKKLEKFTWRNTYRDILKNFKDKIKEKMKIISVMKLVRIYEKITKPKIKEYNFRRKK